jgi:hypothetical protein
MELPRAAKLIRMLSSPSDSEVLSAARALCRMGIHDVAERVENGLKYETAIRYARPRHKRDRPLVSAARRTPISGRQIRLQVLSCLRQAFPRRAR